MNFAQSTRVCAGLGLVLCVLAAAPAKAVTCSGTGCTGQTPQATGCVDDGVWITASPLTVSGSTIGHVQLIYSATCGTVWSRVSTYSAQSGTHWTYLSNGTLNFAYQTGAASTVSPAYDSTEVYDDTTAYHIDSLMYHRSETRIQNGVKACGRITGVVTDKCSVLVDPDDL